MAAPLRDLGAEVVEVPTIEVRQPASFAPLDQALREIASYEWLILTSVNGVDALFDRCRELGVSVQSLQHLQIAAIGPATRQAIESHGLHVAVTPPKYVAESVVEALLGMTVGKRVLLVRAKVARDVLPNELRKSGTVVDVIDAYETIVPEQAEQKLRDLFSSRPPHVITFTSSSTVNNLLSLLGSHAGEWLKGVKLASIGPVTSGTLKHAGFPPAIEAREYTMQGLVEAIAENAPRLTR